MAHELKKIGFAQCPSDSCVFTWDKGDSLVIVIAYINDLLFASPNLGLIEEVKKDVGKSFDFKDLWPATQFWE